MTFEQVCRSIRSMRLTADQRMTLQRHIGLTRNAVVKIERCAELHPKTPARWSKRTQKGKADKTYSYLHCIECAKVKERRRRGVVAAAKETFHCPKCGGTVTVVYERT